MLINSFSNNQVQSGDITYATNQNASYPATNFLTKYIRQKAKFTASTQIRLDNVSNTRDVVLLGVSGATSGTIQIDGTTSAVTTLTSNTTYTVNTDIEGTLTSNDGVTVTSNDGITVRSVGDNLVEKSFTFTSGNLTRQRFYFDGLVKDTKMIYLTLNGSAPEIGMIWAGELLEYGKATEFDRSSGYKFLATQSNYNAIYDLDEREFFVCHANRAKTGEFVLYGSIALSGMAFKEDMKIGSEFYGETNIKVTENG